MSKFARLVPSRLSMWTRLMGQAFKGTARAAELWRSGKVPPDMFKQHADQLRERLGVNPHVKQVWDSIVAEFRF